MTPDVRICLSSPRASIDLRPDRSADKAPDALRSEFPQGRKSSPLRQLSHPSPHPNVQGIPGVMDQPIDTSSSAVYLPFMGYPRPSTRRTDPGFGATWPSSVDRPSTGALFTSRGDALTIPRNSAIGFPHESFGLSDEGQSGATPDLEEE
jgi:hypothetical protein